MNYEMTEADLMKVAEQVYRMGGMKQTYEATYAALSGWRFEEFDRLYGDYIASTQIDLKATGNNTTAAKGNPLEDVARYFLEKGGIATDVSAGGLPNRWTVDGIGETYPDRLDTFLGAGASKKCGAQLFMEAKNHDAVMSPEHWSQHCMRMGRHGCTFGIAFSTGGYAIGAGKGYAGDLYHDWLQHIVHILLSIIDLRRIAVDRDYPWAVLKTAYLRLTDQAYERPDIQKLYSTSACLALAGAEHARLSAATPSPPAAGTASAPVIANAPAAAPASALSAASGPAMVTSEPATVSGSHAGAMPPAAGDSGCKPESTGPP